MKRRPTNRLNPPVGITGRRVADCFAQRLTSPFGKGEVSALSSGPEPLELVLGKDDLKSFTHTVSMTYSLYEFTFGALLECAGSRARVR